MYCVKNVLHMYIFKCFFNICIYGNIHVVLTSAVWGAAVRDVTWLFGLFAELHCTQLGHLGLKLRNIRR